MDFLKVLANVEASAKAARVDRVLLERERGQSDPPLPNFVLRCGMIWKGLTGRKPSANKVSGGDPKFVVFVQKLASIGGVPPPSRNKVATSLKSARTCD
jgi:hypothetical protein